MDPDVQVGTKEITDEMPGVSRFLVAAWVHAGKLHPVGRRGKALLYRWGDVIEAEAVAKATRLSSRNTDRRIEAALAAA